MTYTKSSELPQQNGIYFLKVRSKIAKKWSPSQHKIVWLLEDMLFILGFTGVKVEIFCRDYKILAYCKIEKPEGGV